MGRGGKNILSEEQVFEQLRAVHGDAFDYTNSVYKGTNTPIEVYCKKHDFTFFPTPKNHKNGSKCKHCGREAQIEKAKKPQKQFEEEIKNLYGDKYSLRLLNYKNTGTKVTLICDIHGEFKKLPDSILNGNACDECCTKKTKSTDKNIFIEEAIKVYGDKDDYTNTEVVSSKYKVEVRCTKHDLIFKKDIQSYLLGCGCPKCSAENYRKLRATPPEEYYKKVNEKHNHKYTYTGDFTVGSSVVTFFCPTHGEQRRNAHSHSIGAGCRECEVEPFKTNRRTKEGYVKLANGRPTYLYIIECYNEKERFYKIGKTFRKMKERYTNSNMPYNYNIINIYENSAEYIWDLEADTHKKYKEHTYKPISWFAGYSECYKLTLPIEEIHE